VHGALCYRLLRWAVAGCESGQQDRPPDFAVLLHMSMPLIGFRTNHSPLRQTAIGILALPEQIEYLCPLLPGGESAFIAHPCYRIVERLDEKGGGRRLGC